MSEYTREGVNRAARQIHDSQRRAGNTKQTYDQVRKRVERAVIKQERRRSDRGR